MAVLTTMSKKKKPGKFTVTENINRVLSPKEQAAQATQAGGGKQIGANQFQDPLTGKVFTAQSARGMFLAGKDPSGARKKFGTSREIRGQEKRGPSAETRDAGKRSRAEAETARKRAAQVGVAPISLRERMERPGIAAPAPVAPPVPAPTDYSKVPSKYQQQLESFEKSTGQQVNVDDPVFQQAMANIRPGDQVGNVFERFAAEPTVEPGVEGPVPTEPGVTPADKVAAQDLDSLAQQAVDAGLPQEEADRALAGARERGVPPEQIGDFFRGKLKAMEQVPEEDTGVTDRPMEPVEFSHESTSPSSTSST